MWEKFGATEFKEEEINLSECVLYDCCILKKPCKLRLSLRKMER